MAAKKKITVNDDAKVIFDEDNNEVRKEKKRKSASNKYYQLPEEEMQELISTAKEEIFHNKLPRVVAALGVDKEEDIIKRFSLTETQLEFAKEIKEGTSKPNPYSDKAQKQLLDIFSNFITKYVSLLFRGKYDLHDYDMRRFVGLFVTDADTKMRLRFNKVNYKTFKEVNEVMNGINYMVCRYNEEIDVRHIVQMSFIQCLEKYERKGPIPFSGYIYNYMFFILQKNVEIFLIDQLGRKSFPLYTDDSVSSSFNLDENSPSQSTTPVPTAPGVEDLLGPENIDETWVMKGGSAVWPFDQLTAHQRQLLKWRYVDGIKASQIARKITEHPNTCRAQIQEIKLKIEELIKNEFTI